LQSLSQSAQLSQLLRSLRYATRQNLGVLDANANSFMRQIGGQLESRFDVIALLTFTTGYA